MSGLASTIKQADWKSEKHMPVIECPDSVKAGEAFDVKAWLGKGVAHPNTTEHHISDITLFFVPEGGKVPFKVGVYRFTAHGESAKGANEGPVFTNPQVTTNVTLKESGTFIAVSFCNIHGMWESAKTVTVS